MKKVYVKTTFVISAAANTTTHDEEYSYPSIEAAIEEVETAQAALSEKYNKTHVFGSSIWMATKDNDRKDGFVAIVKAVYMK